MTLRGFGASHLEVKPTGYVLEPGMEICQSDYPLDWYQKEFIPYADEYLALPDRKPETVVPWMQSYIDRARDHFGDELLLLAHYYMGGEIVKLVETFDGMVADSYQLALMADAHPEKRIIVESAVHFMAETIAVLKHPHQEVYITNPKSGCTMEMLAKDHMVEPALDALNERFGRDNVVPVAYMNTSGRIKALTGEQGGAVCTSSNVEAIFRWALEQDKRIFFIPDRHMGENVAAAVGIAPDRVVQWPGGTASMTFSIEGDDAARFDAAQLILFGSSCGVHTFFEPDMVRHWGELGYTVLVHPECRHEVVKLAAGSGSTAFLWRHVSEDRSGSGRYAVGTEKHFVDNLITTCVARGIEVVNLGEAPRGEGQPGMGCGCATMSRNDPPHLVALLDLLRQGRAPDMNQVQPGDVVDEFTGTRERLDAAGQEWVVENARLALERMIEITRNAGAGP